MQMADHPYASLNDLSGDEPSETPAEPADHPNVSLNDLSGDEPSATPAEPAELEPPRSRCCSAEDRDETVRVMGLASPIIANQLIGYFVPSFLTIALVGQVAGEREVAALAIATTFANITGWSLIVGISEGCVHAAVIHQYVGLRGATCCRYLSH